MLVASKYLSKIYLALYGSVIVLLIIPWAYFESNQISAHGYSFLPRRVNFILIAVMGLALILIQGLNRREILKAFLFGILGLSHWVLRGYIEPHYFFEFIYLELAVLIIFTPNEIKQKILTYSSWILYALLIKAFVFRMGNYIHGGFFSSNLYATYIVYLSFVEIYRKRYWNLIPALLTLYMVGSKSSYMSIVTMIILTVVSNTFLLQKTQIWFAQFKLKKLNHFYTPLVLSALSIFIFTSIMVRTDYYKSWSERTALSRSEVTKNNMIMYGLGDSEESESEKGRLLNIIEDQFKDNAVSVKPLITDVSMSIGLRLTQYQHMHDNLGKYFGLGDTKGSQAQMLGHNPHSAVVDFISRLGFMYLILILFFYSRLFKAMDLFKFNVSIIPILAFQPYGFSIGHSIVILAFAYSLAKAAKEKSLRN